MKMQTFIANQMRRGRAGIDRLFVPAGAFAYVFATLMTASSAARADDLDIYTKATALSTQVPTMVMVFDTSSAMDNNLLKSNGEVATSLLHQASFGMKDALRAVMTSTRDDLQMALVDYANDGTYDRGRVLHEMVTVGDVALSEPAVTTFTGAVDTRIAASADDAAQTPSGGPRTTETTIDIPARQSGYYASTISGTWVSSGGAYLSGVCCDASTNDTFLNNNWYTQIDWTGTGSGNRFYYVNPGSNTSITIDLFSPTADTVNPVLVMEDYATAAGVAFKWNDDRSYTLVCPAGYSEVTSGANAGRCKNGPSVVDKVGVVDKNSRIIASGLVPNRWYRLVVTTREPGQSGSFTLSMPTITGGATFWDSFSGSNISQRTGLRFQGVQIPFKATINSAKLVFTRVTGSAISPVVIPGVDTNVNPPDFAAEAVNARALQDGALVTLDSSAANPSLDVTSLVQDQVARDGWCHGNAMAFVLRNGGVSTTEFLNIRAYDGNAAQAAQLVVDYDPASGDPSLCAQKSLSLKIRSMSEDTTQFADGTLDIDKAYMPIGSTDATLADKRGNLWISRDTVVGLRFSLAQIPQGANVLSAKLKLTARSGSAQALKIYAIRHPSGNAQAFVPDFQHLYTLPKSDEASAITWTPGGWTAGTTYESPDIASLVEQQINHGNWSNEHTLGFLLQGTTTSIMKACAWEYGPSGGFASLVETDFGSCAARLEVVFDDGGADKETTYRNRLVNVMVNLKNDGRQPMAAAYLKAAEYLGGYFSSFPGDGVVDGVGGVVDSAPVTPTLATGACSSNTIVFIADNNEAAQYNKAGLESEVSDFIDEVAPTSSSACTVSGSGANMNGKICSVNVAAALFDDGDDGFTQVGGTTKISAKTFPINFGATAGGAGGGGGTTGGGTLRALASSGGGEFYQSGSSGELVKQMLTILRSVAEQGAAVAAPGVSVNALNRFEHLDQLYYSLFKPSTRVDWTGNLKRYQLLNSDVADIDGDPAVLTGTGGFFDTDAQSWWSPEVDGAVVTDGGAATESASAERRIFTYLGDNASVSDTLLTDLVVSSNANIGEVEVGVDRLPEYFVPGGPLENQVLVDARRTQVLEFLRAAPNSTRFWAASIHASPRIITFKADPADPVISVFYGDNRGFLHGIDAGGLTDSDPAVNLVNSGGKEMFAFIPQELLRNAALLESNTQSVLDDGNSATADGYVYGLDGPMTTYSEDADGDTDYEKVLLYAGMRRGGSNYYALDVSKARADLPASERTPTLKFVVEGGQGDYAELGQTWSAMVQDSIRLNGVTRRVAVFSGGYDAAKHDISVDPLVVTDGESFQNVDQLGRMVYMVDAETGELLWKSGDLDPTKLSTASAAALAEMKYSITASPRPIDRNGNGIMDGMYIVDLAGQIFRFDFKETNTDADSMVRDIVLVARLGATASDATSDVTDNRRFYSSPSVAFLLGEGGQKDVILAMTSGYREVPADKTTQEMFVLLRDKGAFNVVPTVNPTLELSDLERVNALDEASDPAGVGWYYDFDQTRGEKGIGSPVIFNNAVLFSGFIMEASASQCVPDIGETRLYLMSLTGQGLLVDGPDADTEPDRWMDIGLPGLGDTPQIIFREGGGLDIAVGVKISDAVSLCDPSVDCPFDTGDEGGFDRPKRASWYIEDED
ncbi:MAG: hypothetical protein ACOY33_00120 [Pseudomonadota bacterium]